MDTNDLVSKLIGELKPVKTLLSYKNASFVWGMMAFAVIALPVIILSQRDFLNSVQRVDFLFQSGAMLVSGCLATLAAFYLRTPQPMVPLRVKQALAIASILWIFEIAFSFSKTEGTALKIVLGAHACLDELALLMLVPAGLMVFMLRKGATTQPIWAGYAGMLAVASFGALGMRYLCPLEDMAHLLIWHFLPVMGFGVTGAVMGRYLLRW